VFSVFVYSVLGSDMVSENKWEGNLSEPGMMEWNKTLVA